MSKGLHKELPEAHLIRVPTGPGKSGKSWTFDIFQYWKVLGKDHRSRKVLAICLTQAIKLRDLIVKSWK